MAETTEENRQLVTHTLEEELTGNTPTTTGFRPFRNNNGEIQFLHTSVLTLCKRVD